MTAPESEVVVGKLDAIVGVLERVVVERHLEADGLRLVRLAT